MVSPARWRGASRRADREARGDEPGGARGRPNSPARSTASSGPLARPPGTPRRRRRTSPGPATSPSSRRRAWSTMARRISSTSASAAMATLTRWRARADASRRSRSTLRARSSADSRSIRRNAIVDKPQARMATTMTTTIVSSGNGKIGVEQAVADELDDRHGDDRDDDAEPADRSHRRSIGPTRACRRTDLSGGTGLADLRRAESSAADTGYPCGPTACVPREPMPVRGPVIPQVRWCP